MDTAMRNSVGTPSSPLPTATAGLPDADCTFAAPPLPLSHPPEANSILRLPAASDLSNLKSPSLHCTFSALLHADYHLVKEPCDAWIDTLAQPPSATASLFLHDCLLPRLVCRAIPSAVSRLRLVHVIKIVSWLMITDDDHDHPDVLGSDYVGTAHRADLVMAILRAPQCDTSSSSSFDFSVLADTCPSFATKFARMLQAFEDLWHDIGQEMPPTLQARFISTMSDYFEGIKVQASFREQHTIPNPHSYIEIRRHASFTIPCFILMEYALGIELDKATINNPLILELHNVALDYISFCNDIVSSPLEIRMGDYFNLPFILYNFPTSPQGSKSFQNAVDCVAEMAQDLNNRAISLISTIYEESQNFEPSVVPSIHSYIEGLSLCMSGTLAWFYETARYKQAHGRTELQHVSINRLATSP